MNKKRNTVLFILAGTIYNLLLLVILLFSGIALMGVLLQGREVGQEGTLYMLLVFVVAFAGSFFIYNRTIKYLSKKIDFDKYFEPIVKPRGRKPRG